MDAKQKSKLERYLRNARKFLWGLGYPKQGTTYDWLKLKGFDFEPGSYRYVTHQLLEKPGIERLLKVFIIPRVKELFGEETIDFLRTCWQGGTLPDISSWKSFEKKYEIRSAYPFLEVNSQFNYVVRWEELAGLWFEEIEELEGS